MDGVGYHFPLPQVQKTKSPVPGNQNVYTMRSTPRGPCLIINNVNFEHLKERRGSVQDARRLQHVFKELDFEVQVLSDQTTKGMRACLRALSKDKEMNAKCDALVVIVLSHGEKNVICGTDHDPKNEYKNNLTYQDLIEPFNNQNCPLLRRKPKLFFIQACQGSDLSYGIEEDCATLLPTRPYRMLPPTSDFLLSFASQEGFTTARNSVLGSFYATHLAHVLAEYAHQTDLLAMLAILEQRVQDCHVSYQMQLGNRRFRVAELCLSTSVKLLGWSKALYFNPIEKVVQETHQERKPSPASSEEKDSVEESEDPPPKPLRTRKEQRSLWVIGGSEEPEMMPTVHEEWIAKYGTGLHRNHLPVANSGTSMLVYCQDELYTWNKVKRRVRLLSKTMIGQASYAKLEGLVYILGGELDEENILSSCSTLQLDKPDLICCQKDMDLSLPTSGRPVAVLRDQIYLSPGSRDELSDILEILDPEQKSWTKISAKLRTARRRYAMDVCQNYLWIFGGHDGSKTLSEVERYSPDHGVWENRQAMPTPRFDLSVTYYGGQFYAIGGQNEGRVLDVVEIYDPNSDSWKPGPALQFPRSGHGSIAI